MASPVQIAVLGSGKGSNFRSILEAVRSGDLRAEIVLVASDIPDAGILDIARDAGIPTLLISETRFRTRLSDEVERDLAARLTAAGTELVALAGYMRVVKRPLLDAFPDRIVNIHPSLLPAFRGVAAWKQALDAGATVSGCSVHLVDAGIDTGSILAQSEVPVLPGDTPDSLHARIQLAEHALYPEVLARLAAEIRPLRP